MRITIGDAADDQVWDAFVAHRVGDVLAQTSAWAAAKAPGYEGLRIVARDGSRVVGGAQLLIRRIAPGASIGYLAKGPLFAERDTAVAHTVIDAIEQAAATRRLRALLIQPAEHWPVLDELLAARGFRRSPVDVGTTASLEVDLAPPTDTLLAGMRSALRRNIRKAERAGVTVRQGERDELETFVALHNGTAERQGFSPITLEYLHRQWDVLHPQGCLELFIAEHDGAPLSGATVTAFGDRVVFKLAGWAPSPESAALRPNDLLHWRIIEWARTSGFRYYDLGGFDRDAAQLLARGDELPESFRSTPGQFKLGFGGRTAILPTSVWRVSPSVLRPLQPLGTRLVAPDSMMRRAVARWRSA